MRTEVLKRSNSFLCAIFAAAIIIMTTTSCGVAGLTEAPKDTYDEADSNTGTLDFTVQDFEVGYYPKEGTLANIIVPRIIIHAIVNNNTGYDLELDDLPPLTYDGCEIPAEWCKYETGDDDKVKAGATKTVLLSEQYPEDSQPHEFYFIEAESGYLYTGLDSALTDELTNQFSSALAGLEEEQARRYPE